MGSDERGTRNVELKCKRFSVQRSAFRLQRSFRRVNLNESLHGPRSDRLVAALAAAGRARSVGPRARAQRTQSRERAARDVKKSARDDECDCDCLPVKV